MTYATLEHVNITVRDPRETADMLGAIFDWQVRWKGASIDNGETWQGGTKDD